jgi:thiol-disulfide isomerase/thioredoxin
MAILAILAISSPHASAEAVKNSITSHVPRNFQATEPARPAPKLVFYDVDDKPREISEFKGRGVVLNFWATWCAPCVKEMPDLDKLNARFKNEGIDVLAVSVDRDPIRLAKKFYKKNNLRNMPLLVDKKRKVLRRLSIQGLPTTVLINSEGVEVGRIVGVIEWNAPENVAFLKRLIGPSNSIKKAQQANR